MRVGALRRAGSRARRATACTARPWIECKMDRGSARHRRQSDPVMKAVVQRRVVRIRCWSSEKTRSANLMGGGLWAATPTSRAVPPTPRAAPTHGWRGCGSATAEPVGGSTERMEALRGSGGSSDTMGGSVGAMGGCADAVGGCADLLRKTLIVVSTESDVVEHHGRPVHNARGGVSWCRRRAQSSSIKDDPCATGR